MYITKDKGNIYVDLTTKDSNLELGTDRIQLNAGYATTAGHATSATTLKSADGNTTIAMSDLITKDNLGSQTNITVPKAKEAETADNASYAESAGSASLAATAETANQTAKTLIIKKNDTQMFQFNGSVDQTLNFKPGTNITLSNSGGDLTINSSYVNTTYTLSTGDSNGQIKVTPNSGSAYNVSIKGLGNRAFDSTDYLPLTGGTLTGNLTGKYLTGTWLQTTATTNLSKVSDKVAVIDSTGLIYYRTPLQIITDSGMKFVHYGSSAPSNTGILWVDSSNDNILKVYNDSAWITVNGVWAE